MFDAKIYKQRRDRLKKQVGSGVVLFLGNDESPMNYPANPYHFRQDSSFLYFFGLDSPGLVGLVDIDNNKDIIFGNDVDVEDIIWMGFQPLLKDRAVKVGVQETAPLEKLEETLKNSLRKGQKVHFLHPYRVENAVKIEKLLGIKSSVVKDYVSKELAEAVVEQRSVKIDEEIKQIEIALEASYKMHTTAMKMTKPGRYESEISGAIEGIALSQGGVVSFPVILSINGQILHNHYHGNQLKEGRMVVNDSGAESSLHYAADITRTIPVSGKFSPKQAQIYNLVLKAQEEGIQSIRPGIKYRDVHLKAVTVIASGLKDLGLMKGDVEEAVKAGAHALFMPHGLGHMMGLDVHDMEDIGEDHVGYDNNTNRSEQFGLAYLRLAKELKPGYVITVEPGIYFIPALIDKWGKENKFVDYIDYEKVEEYRDFSGIRIEDDVLVTDSGYRVLGKPIPKILEDVEAITGTE
jgi:Xaa-Pro aminopeptidase